MSSRTSRSTPRKDARSPRIEAAPVPGGQPLRLLLAGTPVFLAGLWIMLATPSLAVAAIALGGAAELGLLLLASLHVTAPWERAVVFRGLRAVGVRGPGLYLTIPLLEDAHLVDMRLRAEALPRRKLITLDRKSVWVEGALFYEVVNPIRALLACEDQRAAMHQLGQASLRAVVARVLLATLLRRPEQVENDLEEEALRRACDWGVRFDRFRLMGVEPIGQFKEALEEAPTELAPAPLPPGVVHGLGMLQTDPADGVVLFSADLGRNLGRPTGKLPD